MSYLTMYGDKTLTPEDQTPWWRDTKKMVNDGEVYFWLGTGLKKIINNPFSTSAERNSAKARLKSRRASKHYQRVLKSSKKNLESLDL